MLVTRRPPVMAESLILAGYPLFWASYSYQTRHLLTRAYPMISDCNRIGFVRMSQRQSQSPEIKYTTRLSNLRHVQRSPRGDRSRFNAFRAHVVSAKRAFPCALAPYYTMCITTLSSELYLPALQAHKAVVMMTDLTSPETDYLTIMSVFHTVRYAFLHQVPSTQPSQAWARLLGNYFRSSIAAQTHTCSAHLLQSRALFVATPSYKAKPSSPLNLNCRKFFPSYTCHKQGFKRKIVLFISFFFNKMLI